MRFCPWTNVVDWHEEESTDRSTLSYRKRCGGGWLSMQNKSYVLLETIAANHGHGFSKLDRERRELHSAFYTAPNWAECWWVNRTWLQKCFTVLLAFYMSEGVENQRVSNLSVWKSHSFWSRVQNGPIWNFQPVFNVCKVTFNLKRREREMDLFLRFCTACLDHLFDHVPNISGIRCPPWRFTYSGWTGKVRADAMISALEHVLWSTTFSFVFLQERWLAQQQQQQSLAGNVRLSIHWRSVDTEQSETASTDRHRTHEFWKEIQTDPRDQIVQQIKYFTVRLHICSCRSWCAFHTP